MRCGDVLGAAIKVREGFPFHSSDSATVRCIEPKVTVELRDLDELTVDEEVTTAVHSKNVHREKSLCPRLIQGGI